MIEFSRAHASPKRPWRWTCTWTEEPNGTHSEWLLRVSCRDRWHRFCSSHFHLTVLISKKNGISFTVTSIIVESSFHQDILCLSFVRIAANLLCGWKINHHLYTLQLHSWTFSQEFRIVNIVDPEWSWRLKFPLFKLAACIFRTKTQEILSI